MKTTNVESQDCQSIRRRDFLGAAFAACAITPPTSLSLVQLSPNMSHSLTKEERDAMTPAQVIEELKKGNERFRMRKMAPRDYLAEKRASAAGQYPAAVVRGCLDSRVRRARLEPAPHCRGDRGAVANAARREAMRNLLYRKDS